MASGDSSPDDKLKTLRLVEAGERIYRDAVTGALMVAQSCGEAGPCGIAVSKLGSLSKDDVPSFISRKLAEASSQPSDLRAALECAIAASFKYGDGDFLAPIATAAPDQQALVEQLRGTIGDVAPGPSKSPPSGKNQSSARHYSLTLILRVGRVRAIRGLLQHHHRLLSLGHGC